MFLGDWKDYVILSSGQLLVTVCFIRLFGLVAEVDLELARKLLESEPKWLVKLADI